MLIKKLVTEGFRNLEDNSYNFSSDGIILTGKNGQGKTNILEAIYILCYGNSFRTTRLADCIKHDRESFTISLVFTDSDNLDSVISVGYDTTEKLITVNGHEIKDRKDLIYSLPCIVFSHNDMFFVTGEPENRRRFFNQIMTMYDLDFFDDLRRYGQVLRQRNAAVKDARIELLDFYDTKLVAYGMRIQKARNAVCSAFNSIFPDIYSSVSGEETKISVDYRPSWSANLSDTDILEKLRLQRETDIHMGTTTSGPHRDRFIINGKDGPFVSSASTGQIRLASIVMRIAQAAFFRQKTGRNPIMLVDDVMLELDSEKRMKCLSAFGKYSQIFFTFLPDEKYFSEEDSSSFRKFIVNGGSLYEEK